MNKTSEIHGNFKELISLMLFYNNMCRIYKKDKSHITLKFILLLFCIIVAGSEFTSSAQANNKRFRHLTSSQGLSNNISLDITRDQNGFLWIATQDGLNRYDGTNFKIYKPDITYPKGLKTTSIQTLFADQNDYLWIGGSQGDLHRFDTGTEEVVTYNLQTGTNLQNPQSAIIKIIQDYTGILWIISEQNIIRFDPQEPLKIPYTPISFSQESASVITDASYAPQTNSLWVATKTHGLIHYEIATQNILYLNEKQHSIQKQLPNNLSAVHVDTQNNVWTGGTQTGLIRISADDQKIQKFHQQIGYRYSLFHSQISDIISDRQGQIWIGTQGNGVHIFHEKTQIVSRYVFDRTNQYSLSHNIVNKLFLDQENLIWIATRNGISKNTPAEDQFLRYTSGHHFTNGISGQNVQAIFLDHKQGLWVGTDDGGLNFKKSGGEEWQNFVHHPQLSQSIPSNFISAICEDNNNYLWVGSDAGLFTLNSAYNSISYIYQNLDLRTIFIHKNITSCLLCE